jgi:hypothetical protein
LSVAIKIGENIIKNIKNKLQEKVEINFDFSVDNDITTIDINWNNSDNSDKDNIKFIKYKTVEHKNVDAYFNLDKDFSISYLISYVNKIILNHNHFFFQNNMKKLIIERLESIENKYGNNYFKEIKTLIFKYDNNLIYINANNLYANEIITIDLLNGNN